MYQIALDTPSASLKDKTINIDWYKAKFMQETDNTYTVELEINNNKFLLFLWYASDKIEEFQILAAQSFVNLSHKIIKLLKDVVEYLWYRL